MVVAAVLVVLNLLDAIFTIVYTEVGVATESNPLMDGMLAAHPVVFMIAKLALVSLGVALLWRLRHRRTAAAGLVAASSAYVALLVYHLSAVRHLASSDLVSML
jgi:hypothetical protein